MTSLLDEIRRAQESALSASDPADRAPIIITRAEWARYIETGYCAWEWFAPRVYRNVESGEIRPEHELILAEEA